ncbi:hypothetical protein K1719_041583 [Acacia pycnantha]|nr:hypothetical protein K1719_041583 [Acacia pycnantha]
MMNYRNPDFLLHSVRYQDIEQIGSCFDNDVLDPHGYDPSDYYDEIEADMRHDSDRKELEKKKAQKVEFASGGAQPRIVTGFSRINVPVASSFVSSGGLHLMPPAVEVDGDQENPLPFLGQDFGSTGGVHAAILSAANAGSGYMLFAQQKRQEAEEKRSTERKERKS